MFKEVVIWIMRFVLLGMIYIFLYNVIKIMYSDLKINKNKEKVFAGVEVIQIGEECEVPLGAVYPLRPITNIGRGEDNSIMLTSEYVSNNHAKIFFKNDYYFIKDMGSTNGTYLNGNKIDKVSVIKNGDIINIGGIILKVII